MAEDLRLIGKLTLDTSQTDAELKKLKQTLEDLKNQQRQFIDTFGEGSPEVQALTAQISELENQLTLSATSAEDLANNLDNVKAPPIAKEVQGIKQQLAGAEEEFEKIVAQFGALSPQAVKAAEGVAKIKSEVISSEKLVDSLTKQGRFQNFTTAINGAAGAFAALQGAQALFGKESKEVQETLLKVQGALALSQGLQSVLDAGDAFDSLGGKAKKALAGIKSGIAATGIGLLLVALGAIVAYWDDIKELVSGVSSEQEELNELGQENLKAQEDKIAAIEGQEQQLRAQGKSEREILQLKLAQTDEAIRAAEVNLENAKATKKAQVEAAERNQTILKGLLNFLSLPITALLAGVDLLTAGLNKAGILSDESFEKIGNLRDKFTGGIANLVFDPKKTAEEGDATIDEADKALNKLKEKRAGFQNSIAGIDKAAGEKARADAKKRADDIEKDQTERQKRRQAQQAETEKLTQQNRLNAITDANVKERQIIEEGYQAQIDALLKNNDDEEALLKQSLANGLITQGEYDAELINLQDLTNAQRLQIDADYQAKLLAQAKAAQEKKKEIEGDIENIEFEARLSALEEGQEKETLVLERGQQKRLDAQRKLLEQGVIDQQEFDRIKLALEEQFQNERNALDDKFATEELNKQLTKLDDQIASDDVAFQNKKNALDKQQEITDQAYADGLIKEDEYNKRVAQNAASRKAILKAEINARVEQAKQIATIIQGIAELVGKNTKAGKAAAIAGLVIQQAQTVAQITTDTIKSTKAISAKYAGVPFGQIPAAVEIGINVAQGALGIAKSVKAVKQGIADIKGANESASASGSADVTSGTPGGAPLPPQPETTTINQEQVNQLGSATNTVRAYVVEQDVSDSQSRINRLERAARIS